MNLRIKKRLQSILVATLDLSLFQSDGGTAKAWILPTGKAVMVPEQHYIWLMKNTEKLKELGLKPPTIKGPLDDQSSRLWALNNGLARVNYKRATGNLTIEVNKRFLDAKMKKAITALLHKNAANVDYIIINILDDSGALQPESDMTNVSMLDDEEKAGAVSLIARYQEMRVLATAFRRFFP